jgi:DNA invertase Pin-like site-specific DNA recombinase
MSLAGTSTDTTTPDGRLMLTVLGEPAEFDRDTVCTRCKAVEDRVHPGLFWEEQHR